MMMEQMKRLMVEEEGQGMAEYGLILAGVAIVAAATFGLLGAEINTLIQSIIDAL
ncbi:Flp family type IVb pilin [Alkalicoccus saliphilus]|jgi:pilus assembly protein Flp/PilA|nr:Flp family type IVb pilin [Alkalicoccus saliphilus]